MVWTTDESELAEDLWVSDHLLRVRLVTLSEAEQDYINCRIAAKGGSA
ncbi:MAG: hypothetical protein M3Q27_09805 [Actinomycetota bacterium]|nr:hypothetical protein [Actinomycetota bacterium]